MSIINAFIIAFSMYSRIPMPRVEWNDKNMKYSICFFPFVGVVIGIVLYGWFIIAESFGVNNTIFAAIAATIPTVITGGIHMDGFCDTTDALSSNAPREKKLEILKDSNSGAFAIIKACIYFIIYFALFTQIDVTGVILVAGGFVISRALSGLSVVNFRSAKETGTAVTFKNASQKRKSTICLIIILIITFAFLAKTSIIGALLELITVMIVFLYYRVMSYGKFGGITGDLAGYFLSVCELWILIVVVLQGIVII